MVCQENEETSSGDFSANEYLNSLEKWVQDAMLWQHLNYLSFRTFALNQAVAPRPSTGPQRPLFNFRNPINDRTPFQATTPITGIECRLPPLWKRLLAEFLDFLCLFVLKLFVTFILVDFLDVFDWNKYDFDALIRKTWRFEYTAMVELTSELMVVELAHRIIVCLFETAWLHRGYRGLIGGATPGKKLMNLRVVRCEKVTPIRGEPDMVVLVEPGTDLGLIRASIRSFVKNFVVALFLPFTFTFLYFQYNRTGYDILAQSIVIEDPLRYRTDG